MKLKTFSIINGIIFIMLASVLSTSAQTFKDVDKNNEYYDAVEWGKSTGLINGYADQTFKPNKEISRAEFTKIILVKTNPLVNATITNHDDVIFKNTSNNFEDVTVNDWFFTFINIAYENDIIKGYGNSIFKPNQNINFVESAKIITKAITDIEAPETYTNSPWYTNYIEFLSVNRIIPSSINKLDKKITRGEMIEMIYRLEHPLTKKDSSVYSHDSNTFSFKKKIKTENINTTNDLPEWLDLYFADSKIPEKLNPIKFTLKTYNKNKNFDIYEKQKLELFINNSNLENKIKWLSFSIIEEDDFKHNYILENKEFNAHENNNCFTTKKTISCSAEMKSNSYGRDNLYISFNAPSKGKINIYIEDDKGNIINLKKDFEFMGINTNTNDNNIPIKTENGIFSKNLLLPVDSINFIEKNEDGIFNYAYWHDNKNFYFNQFLFEEIDFNSAVILAPPCYEFCAGNIVKDKNGFYQNGKKIESLDINTSKIFYNDTSKFTMPLIMDEDTLFFDGYDGYEKYFNIKDENKNFEVLHYNVYEFFTDGIPRHVLFKNDENIYFYINVKNNFIRRDYKNITKEHLDFYKDVIKVDTSEIDIESFEAVAFNLYKDKNNFYKLSIKDINNKVLVPLDKSIFNDFDINVDTIKPLFGDFFKDKGVYYEIENLNILKEDNFEIKKVNFKGFSEYYQEQLKESEERKSYIIQK